MMDTNLNIPISKTISRVSDPFSTLTPGHYLYPIKSLYSIAVVQFISNQ